ncbi:MAG: ABC transporter ATP-binding protein [Pseudomonadota bacterium]
MNLQSPGTPLLEIDNLSVAHDGVQAVWDVNITVPSKTITALVGPNGAGKTTLLSALTGIRPHMAGRITFLGENIQELRPHARVALGISLIPEGRKLFPYLTVLENLEMGAYSRNARKNLSGSLSRVLDLFPRLAERRDQLAVSLSGGEQQMLAIGRGLMSGPKLLMLDEPSLGLAPIMVTHVFQIVRKVNREGVTVFLVEQNVNRTLRVAEFAYVLETGRINLEGPAGRLLDDPHIKRAYLGL